MQASRIISAIYSKKLKNHLKKGGLVAYPTESCYGIGCLPVNMKAITRLIRLKKRPQHKGMIVVADQWSRLQPLLKTPSEQTKMMLDKAWPAPKTFLLPSKKNVLPVLRGRGRDKLAVRIPAHIGARGLCKELKTALVSTSCNRAGKRPCKTEREVKRQFGNKVWIMSGLVGRYKQPSQIIDGETGQRLR